MSVGTPEKKPYRIRLFSVAGILGEGRILWTKSQRFAPLLMALATLGLLAWASLMIARHPTGGLSWSYQSGLVSQVDPGGPADGLFQVGDRIIAIDGEPTYQARDLPERKAGDQVVFTVTRGTEVYQINLGLLQPDISNLWADMAVIPIAFSFWLLGLVVWFFGPREPLTGIFFLFGQSFALILGMGAISAYGPLWSGWLFALSQWWIGPLIIHIHMILAGYRRSTKHIRILYTLAFLLSLLDVLRLYRGVPGPLVTIRYLWLGLAPLVAAGILLLASRTGKDVESRRKTRIAGLAAMLALLPFVLFSLLPDALFAQKLAPYEISFLALPILPLGYGYAILRYRLIPIERYVNRTAVYSLLIVLTGAIYGLIYAASRRVSNHTSMSVSLIEIGAILALILGAQPMYKILQRWVDRIFYGGWYDDRAATAQISQALSQVEGDTRTIASTLCQALQKTMQLEYVDILLSKGCLMSSEDVALGSKDQASTFQEDQVADWFLALKAKTGRQIGPGKELQGIVSSPDLQKRWFTGSKPQTWLLLDGKNSPQGLLILGERRGGGGLNPRDIEILEVVIRQAGAALENETLLQEVRRQMKRIRVLQSQVFHSREEERKRIAREIHDCTIQSLIGVNYQLAELRAGVNPDNEKLSTVMLTLRKAVHELRRVCADLRPPAVDSLGLLPAIRSRVMELEALAPIETELDIDERITSTIGHGEVALCVYRIVQEAITNVQKHAGADWVLVSIQLFEANEVMIVVEDDGNGFLPPANLEQLAANKHFGLVGLQEQIESLGGDLAIESSPGRGCRLSARLPLNWEESINDNSNNPC